MPPASIDTVHPDDEHLAELLVALRHRTRTTQKKLASLADVPRDDVIAIEAGRAGSVRLERVRTCFDTLDARLRVVAWWRGAAADRLLDERHAALVERAVGIVRSRGWSTAAE